MKTPAQEAKEYAAEHGFVIESIGRRYKCTHTVSNTIFERGGYAALLNEMRAVAACEQNGKEHPIVDDRDVLIDPNAPHGELMSIENFRDIEIQRRDQLANLNRRPWAVVVEGIGTYYEATYPEAVKKLRRLFNCVIGAYYRRAKCTIVRES